MLISAPHRTRPIRFLGVHEDGDWRIKLYGIAADADLPRRELVEATTAAAVESLPQPADGGHGVAFAIAHDARDRCFALIHWWAGENEVHQCLLSAPLDSPSELRPHPGPAIGCVWELEVTDFERRAWLRHVLANPDGPSLDAYLAAHFDGEI
jgi:hypothetical protein